MKRKSTQLFLRGFLSFATLMGLFWACGPETGLKERSKKEIAQAEKDFEKMAAEKGVAEAFTFFADSQAIIRQPTGLLKGKKEIFDHYSNWKYQSVSLKWHAEFVDAAESGEIGYTYGPFTFDAIDSTGKKVENKGYFHTVWKKQKDGTWKYVWD